MVERSKWPFHVRTYLKIRDKSSWDTSLLIKYPTAKFKKMCSVASGNPFRNLVMRWMINILFHMELLNVS